MKIAVIGTGSVGGTLGRRWAELGHAVCFGVRNIDGTDAKALVATIKGDARLAGVRAAAADADVVVLATPYAANAPRSRRPAILLARFSSMSPIPSVPALLSLSASTLPVPRRSQNWPLARASIRR